MTETKTKNNSFVTKLLGREWILSLPAIVVVALVTQGLFLGTIILSFVNWNIVRPDLGFSFAGLSNITRLFSTLETYVIVWNTLFITAVSLFLSFSIGLGVALLLNRNFPGVQILRGLMLIPFFVTDIVVGIIFKTLILHPSFGIAGHLTSLLQLPPIDFLGSFAQQSIIFLIVWQWTPFFVLILLAGLQGVDNQIIQSAQIDGANKVVLLFRIIIPSMLHHIRVSVLLGLVFLLKVFGLIYVTTSGGPGNITTTLPYIVYKTNTFKWEVGEAAALSIITVILTIFLLSVVFKYFQKRLA